MSLNAILSTILVALALASTGSAQGKTLILVITDDMDYEHNSRYGSSAAHTPTINKILRKGTTFTRAWVHPRCAPSLATILTGLRPETHGRYYNAKIGGNAPPVNLSQSWPLLLEQAGWRGYQGGKWWYEDPLLLGFEAKSADRDTFVREGQDDLFAWLESLDSADDAFVWWAPRMPHRPHNPPAEHLARIDRDSIPIPPWIKIGDRLRFKQDEQKFLAMVAWLDTSLRDLGRILKETGRNQNMSLVYLHDNGLAMGHISKGSPYEKGIRSPITIVSDSTQNGTLLPNLVSIVDVAPTLLDLASVVDPYPREGVSLLPELEGAPSRSHIVEAAYPSHAPALDWRNEVLAVTVTDGRYKLIRWVKDVRPQDTDTLRIAHDFVDFPIRNAGDQEVYDLRMDLHERSPLNRPEIESQLGSILDTFLE